MFVVGLLVCFVVVYIAVGACYQWIGARRDRARYAVDGRMIDIGSGRRLYVKELGVADSKRDSSAFNSPTVINGIITDANRPSPTVIFEAGIAATHLNWRQVQERVSAFARTVSYDRGGLGWSSAAGSARTPGNIAIELHAMLERAGIAPPYILVGHSFGGLVLRRYTAMFPGEVAGVVLIDPMRLEEWPPLDPGKQAVLDRGARMSGYAIPIASFGLARFAVTSLLCRSGRLSRILAGIAGEGGLHVLERVTREVGKMPREVWPMVAAHWSRPSYYAGMRAHILSVPDTVREMQSADAIRGTPVMLITPGTSAPLCQRGLDAIGDNVRQRIAYASAHWVHLDEPDLVIEAIREMVLGTAFQTAPAMVSPVQL